MSHHILDVAFARARAACRVELLKPLYTKPLASEARRFSSLGRCHTLCQKIVKSDS